MNHKWENDKCIKCGIIRAEIKSVDEKEQDILIYQYSDNSGKSWIIKRPDCHVQIYNNAKTNNGKDFSIKEIFKKDTEKPIKNYKQDYSELLRNPKWQRKRLEIMQRDNWRCKSCDDDNSELHVHHLQYTADNPWDEPIENLITLCDNCHKAIHYLLSCPDIGMETFIPLCQLIDKIEIYSIQEFSRKQK